MIPQFDTITANEQCQKFFHAKDTWCPSALRRLPSNRDAYHILVIEWEPLYVLNKSFYNPEFPSSLRVLKHFELTAGDQMGPVVFNLAAAMAKPFKKNKQQNSKRAGAIN